MLIARRPLITSVGLAIASAGCADELASNEPGAKAPGFRLEDFQPASPRFGETYGLDEFRGSVLFLPLYAGWCNTCIGCATILNRVYKEWQSEGLNVRVAAINPSNAIPHQRYLVDVCDYSLLQDTEATGAWDALLGTKDDHYIYDADGVLRRFVDFKTNIDEMIVSEAGQAMFRRALIDAGA
ncbi:MAG TPA: redoxin domain-containing protein [Polyangiaceae bacterium]|nr:redoxin domain-containing protein [Polyangiaceae bacterium]